MTHRTKNIVIVMLAAFVLLLSFMLWKVSYGSYCTPLIKEAAPPSDSGAVVR